MNYEILKININSDGIAIITIDRENALNALNKQTMVELDYFFGNELHNNHQIKAVILTGAGKKSFVAGADIKEFLALKNDEGQELSRFGHNVFNKIENSPKPIIAAVNGFSLGGGCELAMACHLRVASENAKFGQPEVNLGLIPGYGGTQRLVQLIGKSKALELCLTSEIISSSDALRLGLVNYVVSQEELIEKCTSIINTILQKSPIAVAKVIESVNAYFQHEKDGFETEIRNFGSCCHTKDFVEGANAFIEKRKANFIGK